MKFILITTSLIVSFSAFAQQRKYSCLTLGKKSIEIMLDHSVSPKRLMSVKENGQDITNIASFDSGSKNGFSVTIGGKVTISKLGAGSFQQVVKGGSPGKIECTEAVVAADKVAEDVY